MRVTGLAGRLAVHEASLFLGNAGTAMRPLTAALAVLPATQGGEFELSGVARMHERPIGDLVEALRALGCRIEDLGQPGYPPLRICGGRLDTSRPIRVRGDVSSQFLTALLLALPLVASAAPLIVEVEGELISRPYVEITLNLLARFGICGRARRLAALHDSGPDGSGGYRSPGEIHVEGDASSASYFIALGAIAAHDGRRLRIEGVGSDSIQGDIRFVEAAAAMGAQVTSGPGWLEVRRGRWPLRAIRLDCNHIPDAAMTLAVMALYAEGTTRLENIASWRVKETDRIDAMATELRKLGARVVAGRRLHRDHAADRAWRAAAIHTYDDHRMAMCFSLAAFNPLAGAGPGVPVRILDPRCVGKTFPDYFETLFGVVEAEPAAIPVISRRRPVGLRQGHPRGRAGGAPRLSPPRFRSALPRRRPGRAARRRRRRRPRRPGRAGREAGPALRGRQHAARRRRRDRCTARGGRRRAGFADLRLARGARPRCTRCSCPSGALPGLVADGRDMGTVIFPDAKLKVFLTASAAERAERRHKQLISKGFSANIAGLRADLEARDERDRNRAVAPLRPAAGRTPARQLGA